MDDMVNLLITWGPLCMGIYLAYLVGRGPRNKREEDIARYTALVNKIDNARADAERQHSDRLRKIQEAQAKAELEAQERTRRYWEMLSTAVDSTLQTNPWLAGQVADIWKMHDMEISRSLRNKKRPALKAAEEVAAIAKEKRDLQKENRMLQYQLKYFETLFPWLEEFKEVLPKAGWAYTHEITGEEQSEYESLREWLSPEEYQQLPTSEKYQRALDRYNSRKKTDWEVGIEYERYIGYLYEADGHRVDYSGANLGLEDMGRDLIAEMDGETLVIQCKRWAKEKTIHEKHIFQLFGTTMLLSMKNPDITYQGVFVTTAALSDLAKSCAERLGIRVMEGLPMEEYPMIKCNYSPKGGKIYHLPMDQQYDRVHIGGKPETMFAHTVQEAEENGYRRAYRWNPNKANA